MLQRTKAPNEHTIPLLMPRHHMVIPHYMGRSKEMDIDNSKEDNTKEIDNQSSSSSQSPPQDIPLLLPQEAGGEDLKLIENNVNDNFIDQTIFCENQKPTDETSESDAQTRGFLDEFDPFNSETQSAVDPTDDWWETPEDATAMEYGEVGPRTTCRCQVGYVSFWLKHQY